MKYTRMMYNYILHKVLHLDIRYCSSLEIFGRKPRKLNSMGCYTIPTESGAVLVRPDSSDENVFSQIYGREEYAFSVEVYRHFFGDTARWIVDAGANIGLASRYLSRAFPHAKFLCIEPEVGNFQLLGKNMKQCASAICENCAVWPHQEKLHLKTGFRNGGEWAFQFIPDRGGEDQYHIKGRPLVDLLNQHGVQEVDILKIDIEGAEKEVVFEDQAFLKILPRIKLIALEIHPEFVSRIEVAQFFEKNGFSVFTWGETVNAVNLRLLQ